MTSGVVCTIFPFIFIFLYSKYCLFFFVIVIGIVDKVPQSDFGFASICSDCSRANNIFDIYPASAVPTADGYAPATTELANADISFLVTPFINEFSTISYFLVALLKTAPLITLIVL